MSRIYLILSLLLSVVVSGCLTDDGSKDEDNSPAANDYLPSGLAGTTISWRMTATHVDSAGPKILNFTQTIAEDGEADGYTIYQSSFSIPEIRSSQFYKSDDALWFYVDENYFDGRIIGPTANTLLYDYYPIFDFSAKQGIKHTVMEGGTMTDDLYVNFNIYSTLVSDDAAVVTPMGAYENCMKFQVDYSVIYTPKIQGNSSRYDRKETHWFAKNIGPVSRVIDYYGNNVFFAQVVHEAVSY